QKSQTATYVTETTKSSVRQPVTVEEATLQPTVRYEITLFNPHNGEDKARLWSQTKVIFGLGFAVTGVIALLPSDVSNWDEDNSGKFSDWSDNVSSGPVWDEDNSVINYIGHPYFGGVYYQVARNAGYNQWNSFVYTTLMSTFYYEYGIEALRERPSIQDLIVTSVGGWLYGEWAYKKERQLRALGGHKTALFFLNPVESISHWMNRTAGRNLIITNSISFDRHPRLSAPVGEEYFEDYVGITIEFGF
ncbi:MAG: hypothetical protein ACI92E_002848, partial [Oceanicoccus sp.]